MRLALIILSSAWTNQRPPLGRDIASKTRPTKIAADGHWSLRNRGQFVIDNLPHTQTLQRNPLCDGSCGAHAINLIDSFTRRLLRFLHSLIFLSISASPERQTRSPRQFQIHPPGTRQPAKCPSIRSETPRCNCLRTFGCILQDGCRHVMAVQLGLGEEGDQNSNSGLGMTSCAALGPR